MTYPLVQYLTRSNPSKALSSSHHLLEFQVCATHVSKLGILAIYEQCFPPPHHLQTFWIVCQLKDETITVFHQSILTKPPKEEANALRHIDSPHILPSPHLFGIRLRIILNQLKSRHHRKTLEGESFQNNSSTAIVSSMIMGSYLAKVLS